MKMSRSKKSAFERKVLPNGKPNPKYVDVLQVDPPLAGQNFTCVSFLSPRNILKKKEMFFFEEFLKNWDFSKSMEKFVQFLNFLSHKYNMSFDDVTNDFKEFVQEQKEELAKGNVLDDYKTFLDHNEEKLQKQFDIEHNFQTNVDGVMVRGNFPTQEEAELRCKFLREINSSLDIYVGPVGTFLPWEPEAYKTGRVEYLEEELNQLMHEKMKNEANAKMSFEQRVKETKQNAIQENMKKAEKSGNTLSQTIDENGNLIGVNNVNTQELTLQQQENVSSTDICNTLFEGDNIVVGKSDYGQSELKSGPFAPKEKEA